VTGDPRRSILERCPDRAAYQRAIGVAARHLVAERLILEEDVERCIAAAANRHAPRHEVGLGLIEAGVRVFEIGESPDGAHGNLVISHRLEPAIPCERVGLVPAATAVPAAAA
jgi:hypothetical protein